ncbi:MAG: Nucleolar protein 9 [Caeruleum heppii]|nr:MAG: Nucleolar protein 9 [Caeruleum heppii]
MPREKKLRGRLAERKRKRQEDEDAGLDEHVAKNQKIDNERSGFGDIPDALEWIEPAGTAETPFFGMLSDDEQDYFKRADELLVLNQFDDTDGRALFIDNVYREAAGKELKIACSQSCSRLMERLILQSNVEQLKNLFQKFSGHFLDLVQHRFASHCCEMLFLQSAPFVMSQADKIHDNPQVLPDDMVYVSMEDLFLYTLNELTGNLGYLMTDRHASHAFRVLLVVLDGRPLTVASTKSLLQSKSKEDVAKTHISTGNIEESRHTRRDTPESFETALDKLLLEVASTLDATFLRVLATHPTGNPALQLLIEIEISRHKNHPGHGLSILEKLIPSLTAAPDDDTVAFFKNLMFDPIGSRLLETIVRGAPGKTFKNVYRRFFRDNMGQLVKNDTASYVVMRVLERLSRESLEDAMTSLLPQVPSLLARSRTAIIKTMVERCTIRGANTEPLEEAIRASYGKHSELIVQMLGMVEPEQQQPAVEEAADERWKATADQLHGSLLAQSMFAASGPLSRLVQESLNALPSQTILRMANQASTSHVLQSALTSPASSVSFRRKIINHFFGHVGGLAVSLSGSHVVDALRTATEGVSNYRERIAQELLQEETKVRESRIGRAVWRNWMMDLYVRRRAEWGMKFKSLGEANEAISHGNGKDAATIPSITLARARYAATKAKGPGRGVARSGASRAGHVS